MKKLSVKSKDVPVNRWIRNFLTDRTFTVALNDVHSKKRAFAGVGAFAGASAFAGVLTAPAFLSFAADPQSREEVGG